MRVATESWQDLGIKVQSILEFTTRGHTKIGLSIVMRVATESWQDLGIKVQSILEFTTRSYSTIGLSIVMRVAKVFVESWD